MILVFLFSTPFFFGFPSLVFTLWLSLWLSPFGLPFGFHPRAFPFGFPIDIPSARLGLGSARLVLVLVVAVLSAPPLALHCQAQAVAPPRPPIKEKPKGKPQSARGCAPRTRPPAEVWFEVLLWQCPTPPQHHTLRPLTSAHRETISQHAGHKAASELVLRTASSCAQRLIS